MDNVKRHLELCEEMHVLYAKKNEDYGDSFHETFLDEGMAASRIRLTDKLNRFKTLSSWKTVQNVSGESIRDTLIDLANYALMTIIEMDRMDEDDWVQSKTERSLGELFEPVTLTFECRDLSKADNDKLFGKSNDASRSEVYDSTQDYPWDEYDAVREDPPVKVRPVQSKTGNNKDHSMSKTGKGTPCSWCKEN